MIYVITLGFNSAGVMRQGIKRLYETGNPGLWQHVIVDQRYPLGRSDVESLWGDLRGQGAVIVDPGSNLGLHRGFNWALESLPLHDDDIVIGYDPDSNPATPRWDEALIHALEYHPQHAWASLMNTRTYPEITQRGYTEKVTADGGLRMWVTHQAVVNSVCAWRYSFLREAGGLREPNPFYGGLESSMFEDILQQGKQWVFLPDFHEDDQFRAQEDEHYRIWKWKHAHEHSFSGDFQSYLETLPEFHR